MAPNDSRYYENSQSHQSHALNNTQGYQQGYWYQQPTTAPTAAPQSHNSTATYSTTRDNYGYSAANSNPNAVSASYRDRNNYDTSTISALPSINSALNSDFARTSTQTPDQTQAYSSTNTHYGQQQARVNSANLSTATQSAYSAPPPPRTTPQTQQTVHTHQALSQSASSTSQSQTTTRWPPYNQQERRSVQENTSTAGSHPSEYIARAAPASTSSSAAPTTRTSYAPVPTSASKETPAPATVNPHAVYDPYPEYQRQRKRAEQEDAERKRAAEAEAAAKEAERQKEQATEATAREAEREKKQAAEEAARMNSRVETPTPEVAVVEAPKKKARERKSEGAAETAKTPKDGASKPRKPRKSAPAATTAAAPEADEGAQAQAAAMTLLATANANSGMSLEEQMREMFKKMRKFNAQDPTMLARMWQQERDEYLSKEDAAKAGEPASTPAPAPAPALAGTTAGKSTKKSTPAKSGSQAARKAAEKTHTPVPVTATPAALPTTAAPPLSNTQNIRTPAPIFATSQQGAVPAASAKPPTMWPADKKQTLAQEAASILTNDPMNAGKLITSIQIATILDSNPSYIELCQKLESLGFRVDRGGFARALLKAVPDVNKSAQRPLTSSGSGTQSNASGVVQPKGTQVLDTTSTSAGLTNAANRLLNGGTVIEAAPPAKSTPVTKTSRPQKNGSVWESISSTQPVVEGAPLDPQFEGLDAVRRFVDGQWQSMSPASMATMAASPSTAKAKGRTKAPKPSLPAAPATKEEVARKRTFADLVDLTAMDSDDEPMASFYPDGKRHEFEYPSALTQLATPPQTENEMPLDMSAVPAPVAPVIASTNNATTQLPTVQAPPQIAFQPRPAQNTVPAAPRIPRDHPSHTIAMVQPIDKYKAIRRSEYNPKTIARDVLLACGRHPDMRHLNAHLEVLKTAFHQVVDNSVDLGTFRWDIADPGGPAPGSGALAAPTGFDASEIFDDADDEEESDAEPIPVRVVVGPSGASAVEPGPLIAPAPVKKRPGSEGIRTHANANETDSRNTRTTGRPSQRVTDTPAVSGYAALRALQGPQLDEFGNPVKKRGRPVGWRKHMQKDGAGGTPAPKAAAAKPPSPEPVYQVYKCEWKDCGAELHNLATLRRHIFKLHGKPASNGQYPCHWNDCGRVQTIVEGGRTVARLTNQEFPEKPQWQDHMENQHIKPIAWEFGDGPAGGLSERESDAASEAYVSDSRGRRVTPAIVVPNADAAAAAEGEGRQGTQAERYARELEKQAEKRKREMGVGIDKGGATLADQKRRKAFVDDEVEERVVDPD